MTSRREEDLVMNDYGNEDEIYMVYKDREELKRNGLRLTPESKKNINPLSCFLACLPNNISDKGKKNSNKSDERKNKDERIENGEHEEQKSELTIDDNNHVKNHDKSELVHDEEVSNQQMTNDNNNNNNNNFES
jgi:hypothetical protein